VDWLGRVPKHWQVQRLKFFLRKIEQGWSPQCDNRTAEPGEWGVLKVGCMNSGTYDEGENKALPAGVQPLPELEVKVGDVLMSRSNTTELVGAVGRVHQTQGRILVCDKLYRLMLDQTCLDLDFAVYLLRSHPARQQVERDASGASNSMKNISNERVADLLLAFPPLEEQRAIVAYLDRKTADIDAVIEAKERMLTLLHEKRQALIGRVVTRGLNPAASTKKSGFEWLGPVPAHWSVERLKFSIGSIEQGWSPQCDNRPADDSEWGVLKVGCVNGNEFDPNEQKVLPAGIEPETRYEVKPGDILLSRGNTRDLVGSAALVRQVRPRLLLCDLLYRLRVRPDRADAEFIVHQLRSRGVRFQIERDASGTSNSMKKIGQETIRDFIIALPPLHEQREIVAHIREQAGQIDAMVGIIQAQEELLREYRQTLISAAVTGKIEVPEG
jgi:type I restriction enzyme S subunit